MEKRFIPKRSQEELEAFFRKSGNFTPTPKTTPKEEPKKEEPKAESIPVLGGVTLEEHSPKEEESEIFMGDVDVTTEETPSDEPHILMIEQEAQEDNDLPSTDEPELTSPQEVDFSFDEEPSLNADTDGVVEMPSLDNDLELDLNLDDDAGIDGEPDATGEDDLDLDLNLDDDLEF